MISRYTVYAWCPTIETSEACIHTDSHDYAFSALTGLCRNNPSWVGFIFDTLQNRRIATIGVALV